VPLVRVSLKSEVVTDVVTVGVVTSLLIQGVDFLLGNDLARDKVRVSPVVVDCLVAGQETAAIEEEFPGIFPACVVTRAQAREAKQDLEKSEKVTGSGIFLAETFFRDLNSEGETLVVEDKPVLSRTALIREQKADAELEGLRQTALSESETVDVPGGFYLKDDVLMRKWRNPRSPATDEWSVVHQVVMLQSFRSEVLRLGHKVPMAGHMGIRKTQARVMAHFYWPKLHKDVVEFCRTCPMCQVTGKPQPNIKPAMGEPFSKVIVDCVGHLPRSKSGFQFLLTIMDISTRFPEAIPLKRITAKTVVDALVQFFTRYGLPTEVQNITLRRESSDK